MFGKTCHLENLSDMVATGTQPPPAQACHYRLNPNDYTTECGVIAQVINGFPTIVEGGNNFCQKASGGRTGRGEDVTAAEQKDPKYDRGFSLGAVEELTTDTSAQNPKSVNEDFLEAYYGPPPETPQSESEPPRSVLGFIGKVIKNVVNRPDPSE